MNRRWAWVVLAVLAAGVVGGAVLSTRSGTGGPQLAGSLGPTPGPNSDGHVTAKRAYLEGLAQRTPDAAAAGLVSFSRLLRPAEATELARGTEAAAVFVKFPAGEAEALQVTDTLAGAVKERAEALAAVTKTEVEALERQGGDAELVAQRRAALEGTTPDCACVYAIALNGLTARRLAEIGASDDVRLVDVPDPLVDDLSGWELTPIFPASEPA